MYAQIPMYKVGDELIHEEFGFTHHIKEVFEDCETGGFEYHISLEKNGTTTSHSIPEDKLFEDYTLQEEQ